MKYKHFDLKNFNTFSINKKSDMITTYVKLLYLINLLEIMIIGDNNKKKYKNKANGT
jgi:hypothetical protein